MTGAESTLFGTFAEPTPSVAVELGRMGIPGDPAERAVRLTGVGCEEIILTDAGAALELMSKLRRSVRYLAGM